MLHEFLATHRAALIERCRLHAAERQSPAAAGSVLRFGIPAFLGELIATLKSGPAACQDSPEPEANAARHGRELMEHGFSVDQVVHDYGDLCQAITSMAIEMDFPIRTEDFRTLNRCLDEAIADAVMEFTQLREAAVADQEVQAVNQRLGTLSHSMRNYLNSAMLAVSVMKTGKVGLTGATGAVLDRSLSGLRSLIDRSLADVRVTAGMPVRRQHVEIAGLFADLTLSASLEARFRPCEFSVVIDGSDLAVNADRDMLLSALGNLLQNGFKFTRPNSTVTLRACAREGRILLEVEDQCGGLPPGDPERLFGAYVQAGDDRSGMGLGLASARKNVEANAGTLSVRDLPGCGCVFTVDLPQDSCAERAGAGLQVEELSRLKER